MRLSSCRLLRRERGQPGGPGVRDHIFSSYERQSRTIADKARPRMPADSRDGTVLAIYKSKHQLAEIALGRVSPRPPRVC